MIFTATAASVRDAAFQAHAALETAIHLLERGFWPIPIHGIDDDVKSPGKQPIGLDWGVEKHTEESLGKAYLEHPNASVGLKLGPEAGIIDIEIDDREVGPGTLDSLFGGEAIATMGWDSAKGPHNLFRWDGRLAKYGKAVLKGKLFPGIEIRTGFGGQIQSVCPPSPALDGSPRTWNGIDEVAVLPEAFFVNLDRIMAKPEPKPTTSGQRPRGGKVFTATNGTDLESRVIAYLAKCEPSIEGERGSDKTFGVVARTGCGFDLSEADCVRFFMAHYNEACLPPWTLEEVQKKVKDAYKSEPRRGWLLNAERNGGNGRRGSGNGGQAESGDGDGGEVVPYIRSNRGVTSCILNSTRWLEANKPQQWVRYDRFCRTVLLGEDTMTDQHVINLVCEIEADLRAVWSQEHIRSAILHLANKSEFSSLTEYLDGLQWDGVGRIEDFFPDHYEVARTPYHAEVGRVLFLSAAARAYHPGCKVDTVPVLIGNQGIGKSRGIAALCPVVDWFTDDIGNDMFAGKAGEGLQGKWIIELGELARVNRSAIEVVKSFISRQVDHYRPPYGRTAQDFPRTCVFIGTTNADQPLQDVENRRYLPIRVERADPPRIAAVRDQLWAEAAHRVREGEQWWTTTSQLIAEAMEATRTARADDAWEEVLRAELSCKERTTVLEAASILRITPDKLGKSEQNRIGNALKVLGFKRKRESTGGREWYYEFQWSQ